MLMLIGMLGCDDVGSDLQSATGEADSRTTVLATVDAKEKQQSSIYGYKDAPIQAGHSAIYCASFQLAWDALRDEVVKEEVKLANAPNWIAQANQGKATGVVESSYCIAMAGKAEEGILRDIRFAMADQFELQYDMPSDISDNEVVAFAYLHKRMRFFKAFEPDYYLSFQGEEVEAFGFSQGYKNPVHKSRILVYDYKNDDDFILEIGSRRLGEKLIFAKVPPKATLEATYESVMSRCKPESKGFVQEHENLLIPYMSFCLEEEFEGLQGKAFQNADLEGYQLDRLLQIVRFDLRETGATDAEVSQVEDMEPAIATTAKARHFIFDKPFLVILKGGTRKPPFFLMWVGNTELMGKGV